MTSACFQGGEAETNRTHFKREENIAGRLFSLPRQIGIFVQGKRPAGRFIT